MPADWIKAALAVEAPNELGALVSAVLPAALKKNPADVANLVSACANADAKADALKIILLQGIAQQMNEAPSLTPELTAALKLSLIHI